MSQSGGVCINRFLGTTSVYSRREIDRLIAAGKTTVAEEVTEPGTLVSISMGTKVNSGRVGVVKELMSEKEVLLVVNKPVDVIYTTTNNDHTPNIVELIGHPERVYPIEQLGKDPGRLLLLTNQGEFVNQVPRCESGCEKEYTIQADKALTPIFLRRLRRGVHLEELQATTLPCRAETCNRMSFSIILKQGLNRRIRRMCEACGYHTISLKRIHIMNISLHDLRSGTSWNMTTAGQKTLLSLLEEKPEIFTSKNAKTAYTEARRGKNYAAQRKAYFQRRGRDGGVQKREK